jgi:DNA-binding transcriptional MerR regulator
MTALADDVAVQGAHDGEPGTRDPVLNGGGHHLPHEELGLLPPLARISGQRRYPESAARLVAAILLYSDAGFTLAEQKALMAPRDGTPGWRQLAQRKLAELDEQIAKAQAAREAISHGLRCPHEDITQCPNFNAGITARLAGQPLSQSHQQLHGQRFH